MKKDNVIIVSIADINKLTLKMLVVHIFKSDDVLCAFQKWRTRVFVSEKMRNRWVPFNFFLREFATLYTMIKGGNVIRMMPSYHNSQTLFMCTYYTLEHECLHLFERDEELTAYKSLNKAHNIEIALCRKWVLIPPLNTNPYLHECQMLF